MQLAFDCICVLILCYSQVYAWPNASSSPLAISRVHKILRGVRHDASRTTSSGASWIPSLHFNYTYKALLENALWLCLFLFRIWLPLSRVMKPFGRPCWITRRLVIYEVQSLQVNAINLAPFSNVVRVDRTNF